MDVGVPSLGELFQPTHAVGHLNDGILQRRDGTLEGPHSILLGGLLGKGREHFFLTASAGIQEAVYFWEFFWVVLREESRKTTVVVNA